MTQPGQIARNHLVTKIISGGQTGADRGGLEAAKQLGIPTGGSMPRGFLTETGLRPEFANLYGMRARSEAEYAPRTEANVVDADGTLIFGDVASTGSLNTKNFCERHRKPYYVVPWHSDQPAPLDVVAAFQRWLVAHNVRILNVAGNRESVQPGIQATVKRFLLAALPRR